MTQPTPLKNSPRQQADQHTDGRSTQQINTGALTPERIQPVIDAQVSTASNQWSGERRTSSGVQSLHFTLDLILTDRLRSMVVSDCLPDQGQPPESNQPDWPEISTP